MKHLESRTIIHLLIGFLLVVVTIFIGTLIAYFKLKKSKSRIKVVTHKKWDFLVESYKFFSEFVLTRQYMSRIRERIEMLELSDNRTVFRKTMRFTYMTLGISLALAIFTIIISNDIYYIIVAFLTIYIINKHIVISLVNKLENKLLIQFEKFTTDMRHSFHEHGMVDEAIYTSITNCPYEMSLHANKMYDVLTSKDVESEVEKYNDIIPNRFFKTFLSLCYTVQKFGDKVIENSSTFITNLNYLKQEVNLELLKREKISYLFKSLAVISIFPVFVLKPLESWATSNLPELASFYSGPWGFISQVLIFIVVLMSYEIISRLQSVSEQTHKNRVDTVAEWVLKIELFRKFMNSYIIANYSKAQRIYETLKTSGVNSSVEVFYIKKALYFIAAFTISFVIIVNVHGIARNGILYSATKEDIKADANPKTITMTQKQINDMDKKYVVYFEHKNTTFEQIRIKVAEEENLKDEKLIAYSAKRIYDKVLRYNDIYFKWWELIICATVGFVAFHIPYLLLLLKKKVMQMNMEDEVKQFHTIILMLMNIERISVEDILEWMEQYAVAFKASLQKCLNSFECGDIEALEQLQIDEPFVPFVRIVENLKSASGKIPISQAFDELKMERGYYQEKRKQDNDFIINKKGAWGKLVAFVPMGAVVGLYLILPFIKYSIEMLEEYTKNITGAF